MGSTNRGFAQMIALFAAAALGGGRYAEGSRTLRTMGLADAFSGPASSRNGGGVGANRSFQRAAAKKRNQARHRKACKG